MVEKSPSGLCRCSFPRLHTRKGDDCRHISVELGSLHGQPYSTRHLDISRITFNSRQCSRAMSGLTGLQNLSPVHSVSPCRQYHNCLLDQQSEARDLPLSVQKWSVCGTGASAVGLPCQQSASEGTRTCVSADTLQVDHKWELRYSVMNNIFALWGDLHQGPIYLPNKEEMLRILLQKSLWSPLTRQCFTPSMVRPSELCPPATTTPASRFAHDLTGQCMSYSYCPQLTQKF